MHLHWNDRWGKPESTCIQLELDTAPFRDVNQAPGHDGASGASRAFIDHSRSSLYPHISPCHHHIFGDGGLTPENNNNRLYLCTYSNRGSLEYFFFHKLRFDTICHFNPIDVDNWFTWMKEIGLEWKDRLVLSSRGTRGGGTGVEMECFQLTSPIGLSVFIRCVVHPDGAGRDVVPQQLIPASSSVLQKNRRNIETL